MKYLADEESLGLKFTRYEECLPTQKTTIKLMLSWKIVLDLC